VPSFPAMPEVGVVARRTFFDLADVYQTKPLVRSMSETFLDVLRDTCDDLSPLDADCSSISTKLPSGTTTPLSSDVESCRWADLADDVEDSCVHDIRTSLMLRGLPNEYMRTTLTQLLDSEGFAAKYNFVYLPTDFATCVSFGYAFVCFVTHEDALAAKCYFQDFGRWACESEKRCDVAWSDDVQGLDAHVEKYRNSPVMHSSVPDEHKPALFGGGMRQIFPAPTKKIRAPRDRRK